MDGEPRAAKLRLMPTRETVKWTFGRWGPALASRPRMRRAALGLLLVASLDACVEEKPDPVPETIDPQTFIEVYVDLRNLALRKANGTVNATERDSVLALHEVAEDDLRLFLEVHHEDAEFMRDLWNEAESLISLMLQREGEEPRQDR